MCGFTTKRNLVRILHFTQFFKHFVFIDEGQGGKKKVLKNEIDVNVCLDKGCVDWGTEYKVSIWR